MGNRRILNPIVINAGPQSPIPCGVVKTRLRSQCPVLHGRAGAAHRGKHFVFWDLSLGSEVQGVDCSRGKAE